MTEELFEIYTREAVDEYINIHLAGKTYNSAYWIINEILEHLKARQLESKSEIIEEIPIY